MRPARGSAPRCRAVDEGPEPLPRRPPVVAAGLGGTVDHQVGTMGAHEIEDAVTVADIEVVVGEVAGVPAQAREVPRGVAVRAEERPAHVVVDAVDLEATLLEECDRFGADEPTAPRDQRPFHDAVLLPIGPLTSPRARSSWSACAKPSAASASRAQATSSARPSSQVTRTHLGRPAAAGGTAANYTATPARDSIRWRAFVESAHPARPKARHGATWPRPPRSG